MEMGSTYTKLMIDVLVNIHALTNMYRASGNKEYQKAATQWLPRLKGLMVDLERELEEKKE